MTPGEKYVGDGLRWVCVWLFLIWLSLSVRCHPDYTDRQLLKIADELHELNHNRQPGR